MSDRRMLAKTITSSDSFLSMPFSAQALYIHICMFADDEGFINNARMVQRMVGADDSDLATLIRNNFLISFTSGVIVIKHWFIHNQIRGDRRKPTVYKTERSMLSIKDNKSYTLTNQPTDNQAATACQPTDNQAATQYSIGKDSIVEDSIGKSRLDEVSKEESINNSFYEVSIPIRGGGEWIPKEEDIQTWRLAFPHISVEGELLRIKVWFDANPDRLKQPKEIKSFVVGWLGRTEREANEMANARQQAPQEQEEECSNPFLQMLLDERKKQ